MASSSWDWKGTRVLPIVYQSGGISFAEWISLFTLGLAPLVAHIVSGTPTPSFLCKHQPKWHERICHYNPTSILWRYAIITDRRIRARAWDPVDMVATNALFYTAHGWSGDEKMVEESLPHLVYVPDKSRIRLLSREMLKTVIVTLQGVQAVVLVVSTMTSPGDDQGFVPNIALDNIFFPLAVLGLLRLCAGLWLTDEYLYAAHASPSSSSPPSSSGDDGSPLPSANPSVRNLHRLSMDSLLDHSVQPAGVRQIGRFRPVTFWGSIVFRVLFLLPICGFLGLLVLYMVPWEAKIIFVATSFIMAVFYLIFFIATLLIFTWYFARGATSTVIPCIGATWYKIYTVLFAGTALLLFVVSALETRSTPCGKYTSLSGLAGDVAACTTPASGLVPVGDWSSFGIAAADPRRGGRNETLLGAGEFWVLNFTGVCIGLNTTGGLAQHASTLGVANITELTGSIDMLVT